MGRVFMPAMCSMEQRKVSSGISIGFFIYWRAQRSVQSQKPWLRDAHVRRSKHERCPCGHGKKQDFAIRIEGQEVFKMRWRDGAHARDALRSCIGQNCNV